MWHLRNSNVRVLRDLAAFDIIFAAQSYQYLPLRYLIRLRANTSIPMRYLTTSATSTSHSYNLRNLMNDLGAIEMAQLGQR